MQPKIAVIGASGFVGSALCERLTFERRFDFVPFIHSTGNAARIARLGLKLRRLNLLDSRQVSAALADCDVVVNCSRGESRVMDQGLRNLLREARRRRIKKFVHISSTAIYGNDPTPSSSNESCRPDPGVNGYAKVKLRQDELVLRCHRDGVPVTILCPPNITGPHSPVSLSLARRLAQGGIPLVDGGSNPCNLVHVDNLVEAILCASIPDRGSGARYFVNETQPISWKQYFDDFAALLGISYDTSPVSREAILGILQPPRRPGLAAHARIALSSDFRSSLNQLPILQWLNDRARGVFEALPAAMQSSLKERLLGPVRIVPRREDSAVREDWARWQIRRPFHSPVRAVRELGFHPTLSYDEGLSTTAAWVKFIGI